jgi:large subunit ribosomal protein L25
METVILEVEPRGEKGKGAARRARAQGNIPAVFYGPKAKSLPIVIKARDFTQRVANLEGTHLIQLRSQTAELDQRMVLVRELQSDPVKGTPLHADLYEVALDQAIEVKVPLRFTGKAAGVALGGILQPIFRELPVSCLPTKIPEFLEVDVTELAIHDSVHIADIKLPEGVQAVFEVNEAVVTVAPPTVEEKPVAAEAVTEEGAAAAAAPGATPPEGGEAKKPEGKKGEAKAEAKK